PERTNTISQHLAHCLQKLPDQQHRLIQGYYHDDRSPQWLSQKEGRSVDAIYKAIQRTRQDLQTCIEKQLRKEFS
ncbi:MAG: hypothetical protein P8H96_04810, partial [Akkermansiaceae bacterium]|nr:hypothetical protein [Akkermansiaceae bacterium]